MLCIAHETCVMSRQGILSLIALALRVRLARSIEGDVLCSFTRQRFCVYVSVAVCVMCVQVLGRLSNYHEPKQVKKDHGMVSFIESAVNASGNRTLTVEF